MEKLKENKSLKLTAVLCFLMVMISLGLCSSGRSMYLTAICDALDLQRGAFSIGTTFRHITTALINICFGSLVMKFGTKKLIGAGFLCLITFALINVFATRLYQFYISNIFLGIGLSWCGVTMASTVVNRTYTENKGKIMGAVLSANGIGGALAAQIISPIIFAEGKPFGYRTSYIMVACVLFVVMMTILLLYKENPKTLNQEVVKKKKKRGAGWIGMDYAEVVKKPYYYIAIFCIFITGVALTGISEIATPHMYDMGLSKPYVAILGSISSIMLTVSKFSTGVVFDKFGTKTSMNICYSCLVVSLIGLVLIANTTFGRGVALTRSFIASFALPLETVMLPFFATELFGDKPFEKVLGMFMAAKYTGAALGSPFGNLLHDFLGNYNLAFVILSIMTVFVIVTMQFVLSSANKERQIILMNNE